MINQIRVKNFKCFPSLQMELSDLTILSGANAAGKSTIIQALLLAYQTFLEKGTVVDVSKAMGITIGSPKALISHNKTEMQQGDFFIALREGAEQKEIYYTIDPLSPLKLSFQRTQEKLESNLFYLNAERTGPRISYPAGVDHHILFDGSNAPYLIDKADIDGREINEKLLIADSGMKFSIQVEHWMNVILGDLSLSVSTDLFKSATDIKYKNMLVDQEVSPVMTGFGISYILSVVTAALWCTGIRHAVLMIENPEAHLHPLAQSRMGKFLQLVSEAGVQVLVETHSEHVIDGARIQAAWTKKTQQMKIYFLETAEDQVIKRELTVDENGELSDWPQGFFDQKGQDLRELFDIRRKNAGR